MMEIEKACEIIRKNKLEGFQQERAEALMSVIEAIEEGYELQLPNVGKWLAFKHDEYVCSECGYTFIADDIEDENYCSRCGSYNAQEDAYEE